MLEELKKVYRKDLERALEDKVAEVKSLYLQTATLEDRLQDLQKKLASITTEHSRCTSEKAELSKKLHLYEELTNELKEESKNLKGIIKEKSEDILKLRSNVSFKSTPRGDEKYLIYIFPNLNRLLEELAYYKNLVQQMQNPEATEQPQEEELQPMDEQLQNEEQNPTHSRKTSKPVSEKYETGSDATPRRIGRPENQKPGDPKSFRNAKKMLVPQIANNLENLNTNSEEIEDERFEENNNQVDDIGNVEENQVSEIVEKQSSSNDIDNKTALNKQQTNRKKTSSISKSVEKQNKRVSGGNTPRGNDNTANNTANENRTIPEINQIKNPHSEKKSQPIKQKNENTTVDNTKKSTKDDSKSSNVRNAQKETGKQQSQPQKDLTQQQSQSVKQSQEQKPAQAKQTSTSVEKTQSDAKASVQKAEKTQQNKEVPQKQTKEAPLKQSQQTSSTTKQSSKDTVKTNLQINTSATSSVVSSNTVSPMNKLPIGRKEEFEDVISPTPSDIQQSNNSQGLPKKGTENMKKIPLGEFESEEESPRTISKLNSPATKKDMRSKGIQAGSDEVDDSPFQSGGKEVRDLQLKIKTKMPTPGRYAVRDSPIAEEDEYDTTAKKEELKMVGSDKTRNSQDKRSTGKKHQDVRPIKEEHDDFDDSPAKIKRKLEPMMTPSDKNRTPIRQKQKFVTEQGDDEGMLRITTQSDLKSKPSQRNLDILKSEDDEEIFKMYGTRSSNGMSVTSTSFNHPISTRNKTVRSDINPFKGLRSEISSMSSIDDPDIELRKTLHTQSHLG